MGKKIEPRCIQRWNTIFNITESWETIFSCFFSCLRGTHIQSFQFKILHNIINCNKKLFDMKIKPSPTCSYCPCIDDSVHFFYGCDKVKEFWISFFNWWNTTDTIQTNFPNFPSSQDILLGIHTQDDIITALNFCIIHAKYYIYKDRLFHDNSLSFMGFLSYLKYQLQIEDTICRNEGNPEHFTKFANIYLELCTRFNH